MSKNRNYTNYSNANKRAETEDSKITESQNLQETTETKETVTTETNTAPEPQITENDEPKTKSVFGTVVNCEKLNIRAEAKADAKILGTFFKGQEIEIYLDTSTDDFYDVNVGFCMKKYIKINK